MTRHILLHVGSPKCGSTYLQRCLIQSAGPLRDAGLHYPHAGKGHPGNAARLADLDEGGLTALFPEGVHMAILSHEDLLFRPERGAALARLASEAGIAVRVLVFLRPFSDILYGSYSQHMKQHFETFLTERRAYKGQSFEDFCTARAREFAPVRGLTGWADTFGADALTLASHRDLRAVIEGALPGAPIDWKLPHYLGNPSLRIADCAALARAIADPARDAESLRAEFKAIHHLTRDPDPARTPERTQWLEGLMQDANARIFERFGYDNRVVAG